MTIRQIPPALLYDSNIYLIMGEERTALIDTGTGFQNAPVLSSINMFLGGRRLDYVFLTHRHYDHVGGLASILDKFNPTVFIGAGDAEPISSGDSESTLGTTFCGEIRPTKVVEVHEGDRFDLGGHVLHVIETPGHTIGSICLLDSSTDILFSGDTLFVDGIGRTDLPTASVADMRKSLIKLRSFKFDGLYSGHGPAVKKGGKDYLEKGISMLGV